MGDWKTCKKHAGQRRLSYFRLVECVDLGLGLKLLVFIMVEDDGSVLRAFISALAVERGGVVQVEEDFEQSVEGDVLGCIGDLDDLSMVCLSGANLFVGRVLECASRVSRRDKSDALEPLEDALEAPEAPASESSFCRGLHDHF